MLDDRELIRLAILEDLGTGDVTTESVLRESHTSRSHARLIAREDGVLSGSRLVRLVFEELKSDVEVEFNLKDGEEFHDGSVIASLRGDPRELLAGERLALNLLSRMSGIATHTRMLVRLIEEYSTELLDTRKTTPLWRKWEKRAVLHGCGVNHRMGLYDHLLIKDNHIKAAGGIERAIESARDNSTPLYKLEVEIEEIRDLEKAIELGADWVLLDNLTPEEVKRAVEIADGGVVLEASGGIDAENIAAYAGTGVDYISSGDLTEGARPINVSLEFD